MTEIFADTSGWASFFVRTESFHDLAKTALLQWRAEEKRVVTTNYIILELIALFTSPLRMPRAQQVKIIDTIKTSPWVDIIHIDSALDKEAWQLLKTRPDKEWSLVDCSSFVLMQQRNIMTALTTDSHFEQAGFVRLLK
ncbi:MAG: 23S rRNA-specific endonuclease VapC20 [bacterium]|nr:23S rRNA-specific endonuclease VapC20 [bacterium]